MTAEKQPIGVFDSGVGGLSVVRQIQKVFPAEDIFYFGDTARVPYGPRPQSQVRDFVLEIVGYLQAQGAKLVVIACNTATVAGLSAAREAFDTPIIGVVEPGARGAVAATRNKRVGVIATEGTIKSQAYPKAIQAIDSSIEVFGQGCPELVLLAERGETDSPVARRAVEGYLNPLLQAGIDTLVLGCTHFPFLRKVISEVAGPDVALVDPAVETVQEIKKIIPAVHGENGRLRLTASGPAESFAAVASTLLGFTVSAEQVHLS